MDAPAAPPVHDELLDVVVRLVRDDPYRAVHHLEILPPTRVLEILEALPPADATKVIDHLDPTFVAEVVEQAPNGRVVPLLERAGAAVCAELVLNLRGDVREGVLTALPEDLRTEVAEILTFPQGSVGRAMKTDHTAFPRDATVGRTIERLRQRAASTRRPSNIFVLGASGELVGVISMRDLVIATAETRLDSIMSSEVVKVAPFDDLDIALTLLTNRGFTSVPVVDPKGRLLGVVRATNLLESAQGAAAEDIQKLFGVAKDERSSSTLGFSLRKRLPWLHVNLATAFLAASVVAAFEDTIARMTILAVYLPVVAGQGGNAGAQSLAVTMRGLIMREIGKGDGRRVLVKESLVGVVNGLVIGTVTAGIAWAWNGNPVLGLVIGLAMIINLTVAGLSGAAVPMLMKRLGLDPAQSSSIVLTTITDVVGFAGFLGTAVLLEDYMV